MNNVVNNVKLRRIEPDEIFGLLDLDRELGEMGITEEEFASFGRERDRDILGIVHDGALLGYLAYVIKKGYYELVHIVIHKRFRRDGIGKSSIHQFCQRAASAMKRGVRAYVDEDLVTMQVFLRECGFVWKKTLREGDQDVYLMQWSV